MVIFERKIFCVIAGTRTTDLQFSVLAPLGGAMGGILAILVKNHFFILLNKFNVHSIIYDSLKFQTSITVLQSFIRSYVTFQAFKYLIRDVFHPIFLSFHFLSILTNSKCKGFYNFQAIKIKCFLHVSQGMGNKTFNSVFSYVSYFSK